MNKLLIIFSFLITLFFTGCAKEYSYPNYDIIAPEVTCKPKRKNIEKLLKQYLDKPYVWAEEGPHAFDCSGLTYNIYGQMGVKIPRVAREQAKVGQFVAPSGLRYGDLIFFGSTNKKRRYINHVGIYLSDGWFAHASSKDKKVTYTNFKDEPIYKRRMKVCRRYLSEDEKKLYMTCNGKVSRFKTTTTNHTTPWQPWMSVPKKIPR